jgi:hypothetical protein
VRTSTHAQQNKPDVPDEVVVARFEDALLTGVWVLEHVRVVSLEHPRQRMPNEVITLFTETLLAIDTSCAEQEHQQQNDHRHAACAKLEAPHPPFFLSRHTVDRKCSPAHLLSGGIVERIALQQ